MVNTSVLAEQSFALELYEMVYEWYGDRSRDVVVVRGSRPVTQTPGNLISCVVGRHF